MMVDILLGPDTLEGRGYGLQQEFTPTDPLWENFGGTGITWGDWGFWRFPATALTNEASPWEGHLGSAWP